MDNKTLLLIDGNSIINRAYYGLAGRKSMQAPDHTPTGALYAFLNIYFKHFDERNPDYTCVCFDVKAPTFRHLEYKEYKAKRKPMPEELAVQLPILKEILDALGIYRIEQEGFEADDLIGSVSEQAKRKHWKTIILTGDKDAFQLVCDDVHVLMPKTINGESRTEYFDVFSFKEKYHIMPEHFIELKSIMGDPSDNIPGVLGIGEKGALQLIIEYGSLDNIYKNIDQLPPKTASKLVQSKDMAYKSRKLATIERNIPNLYCIDDITSIQPNITQLYKIFQKLGFYSLIKKMNLNAEEIHIEDLNQKDHTLEKYKKEIINISSESIRNKVDSFPLYYIDITLNPNHSEKKNIKKTHEEYLKKISNEIKNHLFLGLRFRDNVPEEEKGFVVMVVETTHSILLDFNDSLIYRIHSKDYNTLFKLLIEKRIRIISYDIKELIRSLTFEQEALLLFDISVAAYLLNQFDGKHTFERIAQTCCPGEFQAVLENRTVSDDQQRSFIELEQNLVANSNAENERSDRQLETLYLLPFIAQRQFCDLIQNNLIPLAIGVEMPLVSILAEMESVGFKIDETILTKLSDQYAVKIESAAEKIYEYAGSSFNILSPKQLAEILFERLKLPKGRKLKTGYSTDSDVLEMLFDKHPIISEIIQYRQLTKLKSTFIDGLKKGMDPHTKRIHTNFHQTLTVTGRLSSSNPNLQNIPIKREEGREIRKAFVAQEGYTLVDADYSQIELRLLAYFSGDEAMTQAFLNHEDIHTNTAREIFNLSSEPVTPSMRSIAKTINFSIVYGIGEFSLSADLGVSVAQAKEYIAEYHRKYPSVKAYFNGVIEQAKISGYVETMFNRRRYIHELKSANRNVSAFGERAAMNTPIQGSAADIIKIAMVMTYNRLRKENFDAKIILQVHDELVIECRKEEAVRVSEILKDCMENAVHLPIPLLVEIEIKDRWI